MTGVDPRRLRIRREESGARCLANDVGASWARLPGLFYAWPWWRVRILAAAAARWLCRGVGSGLPWTLVWRASATSYSWVAECRKTATKISCASEQEQRTTSAPWAMSMTDRFASASRSWVRVSLTGVRAGRALGRPASSGRCELWCVARYLESVLRWGQAGSRGVERDALIERARAFTGCVLLFLWMLGLVVAYPVA